MERTGLPRSELDARLLRTDAYRTLPDGSVTLGATGLFLPLAPRCFQYVLLPVMPLDTTCEDPQNRTGGLRQEGDSGLRGGSVWFILRISLSWPLVNR